MSVEELDDDAVVTSPSSANKSTAASLLLGYAAMGRAVAGTLGQKGAYAAWVVGTSALVLAFPLFLEAEREAELIKHEQDQIQALQAQGYSPMQIQEFQARGELGVPPPLPPLTPQFP